VVLTKQPHLSSESRDLQTLHTDPAAHGRCGKADYLGSREKQREEDRNGDRPLFVPAAHSFRHWMHV